MFQCAEQLFNRCYNSHESRLCSIEETFDRRRFYVWNSDVTSNHMTLTLQRKAAPNLVVFVTQVTLSIVFVISEVVSTFNDIWRETEAILKYFEAVEMRLRMLEKWLSQLEMDAIASFFLVMLHRNVCLLKTSVSQDCCQGRSYKVCVKTLENYRKTTEEHGRLFCMQFLHKHPM